MELGPGKVAVVTGAGSGIGLALANAFASAGCSVVLADVQIDALDAAAAEVGAHGVDTLTVRTDVSKREQVEELATATMERFGAVHLVCNNAGVGGAGDPWLGPIETWDWVMGVNFWGVRRQQARRRRHHREPVPLDAGRRDADRGQLPVSRLGEDRHHGVGTELAERTRRSPRGDRRR
jgi:NAD(P)-dependent dehydrogenase (short-subunit alcohol dehydrogenase family)